jgi:uncharacterized membrane protein
VIAGAAAFVSLGSWLAFPSLTIVMGILHLIAFSTIFLFFVKNLSTRLLLFLAVLISAFGSLILTLDLRGPTNILLGFGIPYYSFQTLDYYPLLPWFGVVLAGFVIGRNLPLYLNLQKELSPINRFLGATGRHSLIIYLFHQPILLALLFPFT